MTFDQTNTQVAVDGGGGRTTPLRTGSAAVRNDKLSKLQYEMHIAPHTHTHTLNPVSWQHRPTRLAH